MREILYGNDEEIESMYSLQGEGVFNPTDPREIRMRRDLKEELLEVLNSSEFKSRIRSNWILSPSWRVHSGKATLELLRLLERRGLAKRDEEHPDWFLLEDETTLVYVSLLAKYSAMESQTWTVTGTDLREYRNMTYGAKEGEKALKLHLKDVLPVPRENVRIDDILRFRRRRREELLRFREIMDEIQDELILAENFQEVKETVERHKERIEREILEIKRRMKSDLISLAIGCMEFLISGTQSLLSRDYVQFGTNLIGGSLLISKFIVKRNLGGIRERPLSYLYYAEKDGIVEITKNN